MNNINRIVTKITKIESLLWEVKSDVIALSKASELKSFSATKKESLPAEEELKNQYERLYKDLLDTNSKAIEEFVMSKDKIYLKAFCETNKLPLDTTKLSKVKISEEIIKWLTQRKLISKKAT
jgi:hypothetical protein